MARKKDKADIRKREILESFYQVLIEEGLEGASIAKIAARMGIHPSLIIHYFSTKEEMVVELVDFILRKYEDTYLPRIREIEDPEKRLDAIIDAVFGLEWNKVVDPGVFFACYSLSFRNDRVRESFRRMYSTLREVLTAEIGTYVESGIILEADPGRLADLVIALLEGYGFYRNVMDDDRQFEELGRFLKANALAIVKVGR